MAVANTACTRTDGFTPFFWPFLWLWGLSVSRASLVPPAASTDYCSCQVPRKNSCDPVESIEKEICRSRLCSCSRFSGYLRQLFSFPGNASPPPSAFTLGWGSKTSLLSIQTTARRSSQVQLSAPGLLRVAPTSSECSCARSA
jgi:hypothetical protein